MLPVAIVTNVGRFLDCIAHHCSILLCGFGAALFFKSFKCAGVARKVFLHATIMLCYHLCYARSTVYCLYIR